MTRIGYLFAAYVAVLHPERTSHALTSSKMFLVTDPSPSLPPRSQAALFLSLAPPTWIARPRNAIIPA